jgi:hypothetical protein
MLKRIKTKQSNSFNITKYQEGIDENMPVDRLVALMPFHSATTEYIKAKNWAKLNTIFQVLIGAGQMLQSDYDIVNNVLKEQNVDLTTI